MKSKKFRVLVGLGAAMVMTFSIGVSAFASNVRTTFTDACLPMFRNPTRMAGAVLPENSKQASIQFTMRSENGKVYVGVTDPKTDKSVGEIYVEDNNKHTITYVTTIGKGTALMAYAGNDNWSQVQYVSGYIYF